MTTTLQESSGGQTLQVPKSVLDEAGLAAGAEVEVTTDGRSITITPAQPLRRTGRYTLEEILADMPDGDPESTELDWGPPVDEEVW